MVKIVFGSLEEKKGSGSRCGMVNCVRVACVTAKSVWLLKLTGVGGGHNGPAIKFFCGFPNPSTKK